MNKNIIPPQCGRVLSVSVTVDESQEWNKAIDLAGPQTPRGYQSRKVSSSYPPIHGAGPKVTDVIIVHFGLSVLSIMAKRESARWWNMNNLTFASPRTVLAIGEQHPHLPSDKINESSMTICSLQECDFERQKRVVSMWWNGPNREVFLGGLTGTPWYAFVDR